MKIRNLIAASVALGIIAGATAVTAAPPMMGEPPHFGPGPSFVPAKPYYFDPAHTDHDFNYWQAKHDEEMNARITREREVAMRRAEADRNYRAEQMAEQQRQGLAPAAR